MMLWERLIERYADLQCCCFHVLIHGSKVELRVQNLQREAVVKLLFGFLVVLFLDSWCVECFEWEMGKGRKMVDRVYKG